MFALIASAAIAAFASDIPDFGITSFFSSRKVERGMVVNRDPVFGWEADASWHGITAGFEACHDMTDANERGGKYNELSSRAGYEHAFASWLEVVAEYVYKHEPDGHTQEVEAEVMFPIGRFVPFSRWNLDIESNAGALYCEIGIAREISVLDGVSVSPEIGFGFANARRNIEDFDCHRHAGRDFNAGLSTDIELCENISLLSSFMMYDQFTSDGRRTFENGFFVLVSAAVRISF